MPDDENLAGAPHAGLCMKAFPSDPTEGPELPRVGADHHATELPDPAQPSPPSPVTPESPAVAKIRALLSPLDRHPINHITDGIYIGNLRAASSAAIIRDHDIQVIITAGQNFMVPRHEGVEVHHVPVTDMPSSNIMQYFPDTYSTLTRAVQDNRNILVHCMAGVSRSTTIVTAYLMKAWAKSYPEALQFIRTKRSVVHPNFGFRKQLQLYERMGFEIDTQNRRYQKFLALGSIDLEDSKPEECSEKGAGFVLSCPSCRTSLGGDDEEQKHVVGRGFKSGEPRAGQDICRHIFLDPFALNWLREQASVGVQEGKLWCPNEACHRKVGQFSWTGIPCSCGTWVTPAFALAKCKVVCQPSEGDGCEERIGTYGLPHAAMPST